MRVYGQYSMCPDMFCTVVNGTVDPVPLTDSAPCAPAKRPVPPVTVRLPLKLNPRSVAGQFAVALTARQSAPH